MVTDDSSRTYHRAKHLLIFLSLALDVFLLMVFFLSGASVSLRDFSAGLTFSFVMLNGIYMACAGAALYLFHFPLRWFEGFYWEHKFNLSAQTFRQWFGDDLKKGIIQFILTLITVEAMYLLLRQFPDTWWIGISLFWLFLTLVLAKITPDVIIPLFYKYSPINNEVLRQSVLRLFKESKIKIQDAYLINFSSKTKKANAFICGLGESRRVVLSDNLVADFSIPEVETVVAHEIGHYKNHDILRLTVVQAAVVFLGFFLVSRFLSAALPFFKFERIDDIAFLPVVALGLAAFNFFTMPFVNGYSRRREREADRFSLALTGKPNDFIGMIRKLGLKNLAEFEPGRFVELFFYSHPPISKRIKFAEQFSQTPQSL